MRATNYGVLASHCSGFSCGDPWAWLLHSMWNLPRPGIEPVSSALAGGFLATGPPGKYLPWYLENNTCLSIFIGWLMGLWWRQPHDCYRLRQFRLKTILTWQITHTHASFKDHLNITKPCQGGVSWVHRGLREFRQLVQHQHSWWGTNESRICLPVYDLSSEWQMPSGNPGEKKR